MPSATRADPAALFELGNTLLARGEAEAAVKAFRQCLAAAPNHAGTLYNLGNAVLAAGRPVEAAEAYLACLRQAPTFGAAYLNLAETLRRLGLLDQARRAAEAGLRLLPELAAAAPCLANVLHDLALYEPAAKLYRWALRHDPHHAGWLSSLGNTLCALGRTAEALDAHERALAAAPADAEVRFNRAVALLTAGDFARGWAEYEWRWRRPGQHGRRLGPCWAGDPPRGRTILLHAEQGLGDTLQFVRYAPLVAALGFRVVLAVQPELRRLCQSLPGVAEIVSLAEIGAAMVPPFDAECPLMSLPRLLGTTLETIPAAVPYLNPPPGLIAEWRARLPESGLPRVGLCWAGSRHAEDAAAQVMDRRRSLRLSELAPLRGVGGVRFVSLQHGEPAQELRTPPPGLHILNPMPAVTDLADTAAIVATLDLVISVDTSVAHLAGALGRPVWLLSRFDGCWRWLVGRDDTPWYPTMRLYRQQRPLAWGDVVARIGLDLMTLAGSAAPADRRHRVAA